MGVGGSVDLEQTPHNATSDQSTLFATRLRRLI